MNRLEVASSNKFAKWYVRRLMKQLSSGERHITTQEFAMLLGTDIVTVRKWRRRGEVNFYQHRRALFDLGRVLTYLEDLKPEERAPFLLNKDNGINYLSPVKWIQAGQGSTYIQHLRALQPIDRL